jgi:hypothetical protein
MLEVRGHPVMSQSEFRELMEHLEPSRYPNSGVLQAWWAGEEFSPETIYAALDIDAGLSARDERGHELIDMALARLRRAFPELLRETDPEEPA